MIRPPRPLFIASRVTRAQRLCRTLARRSGVEPNTRIDHSRCAAGIVSSALALAVAACGSQSTPTAPAPVTVATVAVSGTTPGLGASAQFSATATLSNGTTQTVTSQATWASSNTSVATVTAGTVSALTAGESDITATYQNVTGRSHLTIAGAAVRTYTITGTVTDGASGGVLPNIDVQAVDSAGHALSAKTGSAGTYTIGGLSAGAVTVTASAVSYQTTALTVPLASDTRVDVVLPRAACSFSVSPANFSFVSGPGTGTVTLTSRDKGCTWTARSNDSFLTITSGASGLDSGVVSFAVAPNPLGLFLGEPDGSARSGTLTIAGATVVISQEAARRRSAAYDPVLKAPVCQDVGEGCTPGTLLANAGPIEPNHPNTIFNACADGSGASSIEWIDVATPDGTPLTAGKAVRITIRGDPAGPLPGVFIAADALHPVWVEIQVFRRSNTMHEADTILPAGAGLQAIRATYFGNLGPGPCAIGTDVDNDDLVFRVQ